MSGRNPIAENLAGKKFGRLAVIERAGSHRTTGGQHFAVWKCRCDCGVEKLIKGANLRSGNTISCGCRKREQPPKNILPPGRSLRNAKIQGYRLRAKRRKLGWELTDQQFDQLTQSNCYYCGIQPSSISHRESLNGDFVYNGIDRKDNVKGYTTENAVSCCGVCNKMKLAMSAEEFLAHVRRIAAYN
jgi:hypothetical protein